MEKMEMKNFEQKKIKLNNARLVYPSLYERSEYEGRIGKYQATFLIPKTETETVALLRKNIKAIMSANNIFKLPSDRLCLRDGDELDYEGFEGHYSLKAASDQKPVTVGRNMSVITDQDNLLNPGCYVNAVIDFWMMSYKGKRIMANLYGVQFIKEGDRIGGKKNSIDVMSEFSPIPDSAEEIEKVPNLRVASEFDDDLPF